MARSVLQSGRARKTPSTPLLLDDLATPREDAEGHRGELESWEARWRVALMLYWLENWQLQLQELHFAKNDDFTFEDTHKYLFSRLQEFYAQTSRRPRGLGNPLFDSDQDGVFDDQDRFPLDPFFSADRDQDGVPDLLDRFPHQKGRWNNLPLGERAVGPLLKKR